MKDWQIRIKCTQKNSGLTWSFLSVHIAFVLMSQKKTHEEKFKIASCKKHRKIENKSGASEVNSTHCAMKKPYLTE